MNSDLSLVADYLTIVGFIVSIGTLMFTIFINRKISRLREKILFDSRIPNLLEQLSKSNSNLLGIWQNFEQSKWKVKQDIKEQIVIIRSIHKKLGKSESGTLRKTLKQLELTKNSYLHNKDRQKKPLSAIFKKKRMISKEDIWICYEDVSALITEINNLIEDRGKFDRYV